MSWVGLGLLGLGIVLVDSNLTVAGCALLFGVGLSRAFTRVSVARARAAGFEMLWNTGARSIRATRERSVEIVVELRNRDTFPTQFLDLNVTHAPALDVEVHPREGEIPAGGRLELSLRVTPRRVGHHGIHGLTLRTVRAPGLFTVPLGFTNPLVVEVLPRPVRLGLDRVKSGRAEGRAPDARAGRSRGEGAEFRELRELRAGDPFRKIAWKASARRGKLLVVEKEQEERDAIWILVDASLESAGGAPGEAPLDRALDQMTRLAEEHLERGDRVGVSIVAARELTRVALGQGPKHFAEILQKLSFSTHTSDADRSDWDEADVQRRVLDHLRSIDANAAHLDPTRSDAFLEAVQSARRRAPVEADAPWAPTPRERLLRQYLLSFGIQAPPRGVPERHRAEREIARILREVTAQRPRPTSVHLFLRSPGFDTARELVEALGLIPKRRVQIHFHTLDELPPHADPGDWKARIVRDALRARLELEATRARSDLLARGIRVSAPRAAFGSSPLFSSATPAEEEPLAGGATPAPDELKEPKPSAS